MPAYLCAQQWIAHTHTQTQTHTHTHATSCQHTGRERALPAPDLPGWHLRDEL
jgi:hypothetical protein